jgi:hypothetical protein
VKGAIALPEIGEDRGHSKLKDLVVEASRSLARLDAGRLEELALSCQALNRDLTRSDLACGDGTARAALAFEAREAVQDMAVLARVLEATRANLNVMNRLRELRGGRREYGEGQMREWVRTENIHGDN